ncbi:MAG TPA: hypothetical protein DDX91_09600 [Ruminococcaceae bacterium]|nr:hypothetical protein [Oscillospiraceae bacterium]
MAEFFETFKDIAAAAMKKADTACRAAKLTLSKAALNRLLENQYIELGKTVYNMCKSGSEDSREIVSVTVQIDGTRKRIAALDRRIDDVLGLVKCPGCGSVIKMKNAYCSGCGKRLAAEQEDIEANENETVISRE